MIEYNLVKTKRKTLALYVRHDGSIEVRAPLKASKSYIDSFVEKKSDWIHSTLDRINRRKEEKKTIRLSKEEELRYRKQFSVYLEQRCAEYARAMGLHFGTIRVTGARTVLGSCNSVGDLSFTYRILFAGEELVDYVIVHELSHRMEMNHSPRFWSIVEAAMPDYKERRKKLKEFQHKIEFITEDTNEAK